MTIVLSAVVAYVLGSLNFSIILSKFLFRQDIREGGSGNAGATNMARRFGKAAGLLTLVGDMLKAAAALYLGHLLAGELGMAVAGPSCQLGHCFPAFYRFKGGKGSACFAGVVLAFQPLLFPVLLVICITLGLILDYAFVVPVSAVMLFPFMAAYRTHSLSVLLITLAMGLLIVIQHKENFIAVKDGTEGRFRSWFAEKIRAKI